MGTQIDLRDDAGTIEKLAKNKQKPLSLEMGEKLAKELRAVKYVECSALTQVKYNKPMTLINNSIVSINSSVGGVGLELPPTLKCFLFLGLFIKLQYNSVKYLTLLLAPP